MKMRTAVTFLATVPTAVGAASLLSAEDAEARFNGWQCGETNPTTIVGCIGGVGSCRIGTMVGTAPNRWCDTSSMEVSDCCQPGEPE